MLVAVRQFPKLGRFEICLPVADIAASAEFYGALGFRKTGGNREENWEVLARGEAWVGLFKGMFDDPFVNFRAGDIGGLLEAAEERGLEPTRVRRLDHPRCGSFILSDPDGNQLFFDTVLEESEGPLGKSVAANAGQFPKLGRLDWCVKSGDAGPAIEFYKKLDFYKAEGEAEAGWAVMARGEARIGVYTGQIERPTLNFRGGAIARLVKASEALGLEVIDPRPHQDERCGSFTLLDPDGTPVFFDTAPHEAESK